MNLPGELNATLVNPPPNFKEWQFCNSFQNELGPEALYYSENNSIAEKGHNMIEQDNPAAYGANLIYRGSFHNYSNTDQGRVYAFIRGRSVREKYFGAAYLALEGQPFMTFSSRSQLKPIPDPSYATPTYTAHDLTSVYPESTHIGYVSVAPNSGGTLQIRIANGGGAATPANIVLSRELVWMTGNEGAG